MLHSPAFRYGPSEEGWSASPSANGLQGEAQDSNSDILEDVVEFPEPRDVVAQDDTEPSTPSAVAPWQPRPQGPSRDWRVTWLQDNLHRFNLDQQAYLGALQHRKSRKAALRRVDVTEEELAEWEKWDTFIQAANLCRAVAWSMGPAIARNTLNGGAPAAAARLVAAVDEAPQYHDMIHAADRVLIATGVMPTGQAAQVNVQVANISASETRWEAYVAWLAEKAKAKEG